MNIQKYSQSLPFKVEAYETELIKTREEIKNFIKWQEGLLFGKIGLDAGVGLIPVVGGIYTGVMGVWLLIQADKVRSGLQEKFFIAFLTILDIIIGVFVFAGDILDALFRVHAWNGKRIILHIDDQLSLINKAKEQLEQGRDTDLATLEDILFRKGKTKEEQIRIQIAIAVFVFLIFVGCNIL